MHRGASPGFDVQRCNPCHPPSCSSSLAKGPQHTPGGGGVFGNFRVWSFFFSCSQARRVLYSLRPQHPAKIFIRICCRICGARAMTLATPIDRLSVKARARGSEGTQTVEPRSGERDPAPRRATPTSDATSEVKVRLTDTCRHVARHHVFFSLEEWGGLESAPRGYGAGEATSAHLRHGVRRLREGGGGLVDLEA